MLTTRCIPSIHNTPTRKRSHQANTCHHPHPVASKHGRANTLVRHQNTVVVGCWGVVLGWGGRPEGLWVPPASCQWRGGALHDGALRAGWRRHQLPKCGTTRQGIPIHSVNSARSVPGIHTVPPSSAVQPSPLASALASCLQVCPQVRPQVLPQLCRLCSLARASLKTSVGVADAVLRSWGGAASSLEPET